MKKELRNDIVKTIRIAVLIVLIYIGIKWVIPLVWPIAVGAVIAKILSPFVKLLNEKMRLPECVSALISMVILTSVAGVGGFYIFRILIVQLRRLVDNWENISAKIGERVHEICGYVENSFCLGDGTIYKVFSNSFETCVKHGKEKIVSLVMNNSLSGFVCLVEITAAIIICVVSTYYFLAGTKEGSSKTKTNRNDYIFKEQIKLMESKINHIFKAFFRAQIIIMIIDVIVCFVGFAIIKNPYSLLVAIVVGFMDALPMIGIGLILIPWILVMLFAGMTKNAIVLFVVFMICYIVREILEPKLIGENIGLSPIMSLLTLFAGYKLFGIIGLFVGPFIYMIITEDETSL
jgi:sporulation integral membrane protein YtvI